MSFSTLPPDVRETAERVLTDKQLVALRLWENGAGYGRIGLILNISTSTARGRVTRAIDTLRRALEEEDGSVPYSLRRPTSVSATESAGGRAA